MRCPNCIRGKLYEHGMTMHQRCPVCNLRFEREPGYFFGSMYVSYGVSSVLLMLALGVGHWFFPDIDLGWMVLICAACFVPFVPLVTRYSRVIWIYFDRWASPTRPEEMD